MAVAKEMVLDRLSPPPALDLAAFLSGDGIIATTDGKQIAVSRDADGRVHAVSAECSHLGCILGWNAGMRTWDCPCHGSLFAPDGAGLHGTAVNDLESVALPEEAATTNR